MGDASPKEQIFAVKGMHCASCEILIERRLKEIKGVKKVKASTSQGKVIVEYNDKEPAAEQLNQIFKENGYTFSEEPMAEPETSQKTNVLKIILIAIAVIVAFFVFNKLGLSSLVNIKSQSSLPTFFSLGLLAGLSTCAALVGGIVLSMSKQWLALYSDKDSTWQKLQPHLIFNSGRLASYAVLGGMLGAIGSQLRLSITFSSILVMIVSVIMFLLGLQMLGIKSLRKFQIRMPRFITRHATDETKFQGRWLPFLMGALTFFLPCGFTITAQGMALLSGSFIQGGLIMLFFALGTTLPLLAIGLSSVKFTAKPNLASTFMKVAGIVVLFFALFNINNQLNVLGAPSLSNLSFKAAAPASSSAQTIDKDLPPLVDGKQVIKMDTSSSGYNPNHFKVRAGVPVRWEVTDVGTSGCTNAVISRSLFNGQIDLVNGQTSIKEFTPKSPGQYKFSCWMGMISGTIEVVDQNGNAPAASSNSNSAINASGANGASCSAAGGGCGCGGLK